MYVVSSVLPTVITKVSQVKALFSLLLKNSAFELSIFFSLSLA
uniref:Uncharacterized protein n=1 Tax=Ciona intestinalis TaxID=7719 RepID=H2XXB2_CIOIN